VAIAEANPGRTARRSPGRSCSSPGSPRCAAATTSARGPAARVRVGREAPGGEIYAATLLEQQARILKDAGRAAEAEPLFDRAEAATSPT